MIFLNVKKLEKKISNNEKDFSLEDTEVEINESELTDLEIPLLLDTAKYSKSIDTGDFYAKTSRAKYVWKADKRCWTTNLRDES